MKQTMKPGTAISLALLFAVFTLIGVDSSLAAPCDGVPQCEPQTKESVFYSSWRTKGWAYYCTGDHPYYWNNDSILGFGNNFSWEPHENVSVIENPFAESSDSPSKMDATITNWDPSPRTITVTLGCSQQPQDVSCPNINKTKVGPDPKCPMQGSIKNH